MRRRHLTSVKVGMWQRAAVTAAISLVAIGITLDAQTAPRTRLLPHGRNLLQQLLPDDEIVVITREYDSAVPYRRPTAATGIQDLAEFAKVIAVVEIDKVEGEFVEGGEWIRTRVDARVERLVRPSTSVQRAGQPIELLVDGGEARLGTVLVRANVALRLPIGRHYLVFAREVDAVLYATAPILVEDGRLAPTWPPELVSKGDERPQPGGFDTYASLVGLSLEDAVSSIQAQK